MSNPVDSRLDMSIAIVHLSIETCVVRCRETANSREMVRLSLRCGEGPTRI